MKFIHKTSKENTRLKNADQMSPSKKTIHGSIFYLMIKQKYDYRNKIVGFQWFQHVYYI